MSSGQGTGTVDVSAAVRQVVTEMSPAGASNIGPQSKLVADLGFDSLGVVELLVVLEDTLELAPIEEQGLVGMESVADLERVVEEALAR
jgi:acyl carrier protein